MLKSILPMMLALSLPMAEVPSTQYWLPAALQ